MLPSWLLNHEKLDLRCLRCQLDQSLMEYVRSCLELIYCINCLLKVCRELAIKTLVKKSPELLAVNGPKVLRLGVRFIRILSFVTSVKTTGNREY